MWTGPRSSVFLADWTQGSNTQRVPKLGAKDHGKIKQQAETRGGGGTNEENLL